MTGAEQEVEVILVREGKTKEKGTVAERERERNKPTEEADSVTRKKRGHTNREHKTGSETEM